MSDKKRRDVQSACHTSNESGAGTVVFGVDKFGTIDSRIVRVTKSDGEQIEFFRATLNICASPDDSADCHIPKDGRKLCRAEFVGITLYGVEANCRCELTAETVQIPHNAPAELGKVLTQWADDTGANGEAYSGLIH